MSSHPSPLPPPHTHTLVRLIRLCWMRYKEILTERRNDKGTKRQKVIDRDRETDRLRRRRRRNREGERRERRRQGDEGWQRVRKSWERQRERVSAYLWYFSTQTLYWPLYWLICDKLGNFENNLLYDNKFRFGYQNYFYATFSTHFLLIKVLSLLFIRLYLSKVSQASLLGLNDFCIYFPVLINL